MVKKKRGRPRKNPQVLADIVPIFAGESTASTGYLNYSSSSDSPRRRNRAGTIDRSDKYIHIKNALNPFNISNGSVDISEAIELCQKACWCFPLLRNVIDIMTELANSRVYLEKGSTKANNFIGAWFDKIGMWKLKDQFYREYFRSGNIFFYRFDAEIDTSEMVTKNTVFGAKKAIVPIRYVLLNPSQLKLSSDINFIDPQYMKVLTAYEIDRLKNPRTKQEIEFLKSMPPEFAKDIKSGRSPNMPLDSLKLHAFFYKKQDYEPFAIPMAFPLLEDINWKLELKKVDAAIARTTDWIILLFTMGDKDKGVNAKHFEALKNLLSSESVKRTLVADYTTKGEWLIPEISKVLGPEKYVQVDKDIREGLNSIFFSEGEKFANTNIKVQIFLERLVDAQNAFLKFLQEEVNRVCDAMNFKMYPVVKCEKVDLEDPIQYGKLYAQLMQLGVLTPEEGLVAMETGKLPDADESLESQKRMKEYRKQELYVPIIGGAQKNVSQDGRPEGTSSPQTTKNISPIGASISVSALRGVMTKASELEDSVLAGLRKKFNTKKLSAEHKEIGKLISQSIMINEENWADSVASYLDEPKQPDGEKAKEIDDLAAQHGIQSFEALLLWLAQKDGVSK